MLTIYIDDRINGKTHRMQSKAPISCFELENELKKLTKYFPWEKHPTENFLLNKRRHHWERVFEANEEIISSVNLWATSVLTEFDTIPPHLYEIMCRYLDLVYVTMDINIAIHNYLTNAFPEHELVRQISQRLQPA